MVAGKSAGTLLLSSVPRLILQRVGQRVHCTGSTRTDICQLTEPANNYVVLDCCRGRVLGNTYLREASGELLVQRKEMTASED